MAAIQIHEQEQPVYVVSGGVGTSGELLVRTVLAQFRDAHVPIIIIPSVRQEDQIDEILARAATEQATIVHTLMDANLRQRLNQRAEVENVTAIDLVGDLLAHLGQELHQEPLSQPGRYRQLNDSYFKRIEAMEFAVLHDDGQRVAELDQADIVLVGVSRVGKTPLSIYMSLGGWKVANVPVVPGISLPDELRSVPYNRIFGLMMQPQQLLTHRRWRQQHMSVTGGAYVDRVQVAEELRAANHLFYERRFTIIDVTNKPIETTCAEIISAVDGMMIHTGVMCCDHRVAIDDEVDGKVG